MNGKTGRVERTKYRAPTLTQITRLVNKPPETTAKLHRNTVAQGVQFLNKAAGPAMLLKIYLQISGWFSSQLNTAMVPRKGVSFHQVSKTVADNTSGST